MIHPAAARGGGSKRPPRAAGFVESGGWQMGFLYDTKRQVSGDPLPAWAEGAAKKAVLRFLHRTTAGNSPHFVPEAERVAVFSGGGTLWPERPAIEAHFALAGVQAAAARDPSLRERQPFQAALARDLAALSDAGAAATLELVARSHGDMASETFEEQARRFLVTAMHPRLDLPYTEMAYQPMSELCDLLRVLRFELWVCAAGTVDFARLVAHRLYGVPRAQVIGSSVAEELRDVDGRAVVWRLPAPGELVDGARKAVALCDHVGSRPLFAAGSGGNDVEMLRYGQGRSGPSFQLLVAHDDPARELTGGDGDGERQADAETRRLAAARDWTVASVRDDWRSVFAARTARAGVLT